MCLQPITLVVNTCLLCVVSAARKTAAVTPVLKKTGSDPTSLLNYRPISNLPFMAKMLERAVASQRPTFLNHHNLFEPFQSGFCSCNSTETALLCVVNNLLLSADFGSLNILILGLSETINQNVLISCGKSCDIILYRITRGRVGLSWNDQDFMSAIGISGTALNWFQSCLTNRKQLVTLGPHQSHMSPITCGVPRGSVLGAPPFPRIPPPSWPDYSQPRP